MRGPMGRAGDRDALALAAGEIADRRHAAEGMRTSSSRTSSSVSRDHPPPVEPAKRPGDQLAAEEQVHVDRLAARPAPDPGRRPGCRARCAFARVGESRLASPSISDAAGGRRMDAADDLHQRRLAGAVVADQRHDLAGMDVERDILDARRRRRTPCGCSARPEDRRPGCGDGRRSRQRTPHIGQATGRAEARRGSSRPPARRCRCRRRRRRRRASRSLRRGSRRRRVSPTAAAAPPAASIMP